MNDWIFKKNVNFALHLGSKMVDIRLRANLEAMSMPSTRIGTQHRKAYEDQKIFQYG